MPETNTTASWSRVKTRLRDFDRTALLGLLQDLYAAKKGAFVTKSRTAAGMRGLLRSLSPAPAGLVCLPVLLQGQSRPGPAYDDLRTEPLVAAGVGISCVADAALDIDEAAFAEMLLGKLNELGLEDRDLMPLHVFSGSALIACPPIALSLRPKTVQAVCRWRRS